MEMEVNLWLKQIFMNKKAERNIQFIYVSIIKLGEGLGNCYTIVNLFQNKQPHLSIYSKRSVSNYEGTFRKCMGNAHSEKKYEQISIFFLQNKLLIPLPTEF